MRDGNGDQSKDTIRCCRIGAIRDVRTPVVADEHRLIDAHRVQQRNEQSTDFGGGTWLALEQRLRVIAGQVRNQHSATLVRNVRSNLRPGLRRVGESVQEHDGESRSGPGPGVADAPRASRNVDGFVRGELHRRDHTPGQVAKTKRPVPKDRPLVSMSVVTDQPPANTYRSRSVFGVSPPS